jgi:PhzF family phenazine biosynthesis protein
MILKFYQVDVFTSIPFKGNPVAVIFDADHLSDNEMQKIANWTNLSETTFIQSSSIGDYKLRIFTPKNELKFAGHPTVGSAFAFLKSGKLSCGKDEFVQECKAGLIKIKTVNHNILAKFPEINLPDIKVNSSKIEEAIGCSITSNPIAINSGPVWLTFSVANKKILNNIIIDIDKTLKLSQLTGISGLNVYCIDEKASVHLRTFAPILGILEDPVCGSGNAAVAVHLKLSGMHKIVGKNYLAYQGSGMGREGIVQVITSDNDIYIGGDSVIVIDGEISI